MGRYEKLKQRVKKLVTAENRSRAREGPSDWSNDILGGLGGGGGSINDLLGIGGSGGSRPSRRRKGGGSRRDIHIHLGR